MVPCHSKLGQKMAFYTSRYGLTVVCVYGEEGGASWQTLFFYHLCTLSGRAGETLMIYLYTYEVVRTALIVL